MTCGGEAGRLAALEQTLLGAAARESQRRRLRRRRTVAVLAVAAPLTLAAGSVAATHGFLSAVEGQFATLRDDRLIPHTAPSARLSNALGTAPRDWESRRAWLVAGQRVSGYITPHGTFCYRFGALTGGCVAADELTPSNPISYSYDYGPKTFRVYGLAIDGVMEVSLQARGVTRRVELARNAIYLADDSLGGTGRFSGALIVRMRSGATVRLPIRASGGLRPTGTILPILPGLIPARDTAA